MFRAKLCVRCHGGANDWNRAGPSLDQYRGRFSAIQMAEAMWNHGRDMAPVMRANRVAWPKFVGAEMGDLLAYLQAGNEGVGGERVYFEPGSPRGGERLFKEKRCVSCHAMAGRGGRLGPDLGSRRRDLVGSVSSIAGLMWNHSPVMTAEAKRLGIPPVTFSGQEMADIIAYLYFVNYTTVTGAPDRGARLFTSRCRGCHSVGDGPNVGTDLGTAPGLDEPLALITSMWKSAPKMADALRERGLAWPRFEPGEAADLTAFLLTRRRGGASAAGRVAGR